MPRFGGAFLYSPNVCFRPKADIGGKEIEHNSDANSETVLSSIWVVSLA
jgi:hypothetical protein